MRSLKWTVKPGDQRVQSWYVNDGVANVAEFYGPNARDNAGLFLAAMLRELQPNPSPHPAPIEREA